MTRAVISKRNHTQSGNVLFYILIAVALLAALSYAVSESTRGNAGQINTERARLYASEIIEYSNVMSSAVAQLRLRGVDDDELCFDHPNWGSDNYDHAGCLDNINKLYHPNGAGLSWAQPPAEAMATTPTPDNLWHIYGDNVVQDIGSTCAAAACADLILMVDELDAQTCIQINELLNVTNPASIPPTDADIGETRFIGTFAATNTIGDEAGGANFRGRTAACFQKTTAPASYAFYKVLIAR